MTEAENINRKGNLPFNRAIRGLISYIVIAVVMCLAGSSCGEQANQAVQKDKTISEKCDVIAVKITTGKRDSVTNVRDRLVNSFKKNPPQLIRISTGGKVGLEEDKSLNFYFVIVFSKMQEADFRGMAQEAFPEDAVQYIHLERFE